MKAIEFEQHNVVFAGDQNDYLPLPAYAQDNGLVTFCMELDDRELEEIKKTKILKLTVLTFGWPAQPIRITTAEPAFPVTHKGRFHCNPKSWGDGPKTPATFEIELYPINIQALKKTKRIWVTAATFGTPLQPLTMILNS